MTGVLLLPPYIYTFPPTSEASVVSNGTVRRNPVLCLFQYPATLFIEVVEDIPFASSASVSIILTVATAGGILSTIRLSLVVVAILPARSIRSASNISTLPSANAIVPSVLTKSVSKSHPPQFSGGPASISIYW